jgi:hypothetical protein
MLERLLNSKIEIKMFYEWESKTVTELSDEKWLWYLALLYDITHLISWSGNVIEEMYEDNAQ